jgi:hypothetical protein
VTVSLIGINRLGSVVEKEGVSWEVRNEVPTQCIYLCTYSYVSCRNPAPEPNRSMLFGEAVVAYCENRNALIE